MKTITIKFKLTILITFLVILIMFLVGFISLTREERNIKEQIKFQGYALAKTLSLSALEPLLQHNLTMLTNYVNSISDINLSDLVEIDEEVVLEGNVSTGSELVKYVFLLDEFDNSIVHSNYLLVDNTFDNLQTKYNIPSSEAMVNYIKHKTFLLVPNNLRVTNITDLKDKNLYVFNKYKELNYIFPEQYLQLFSISENIFDNILFTDITKEIIDQINLEEAVIGVSIYDHEDFSIPGFKKIFEIRNIDIMDFSVPITSIDYVHGTVRLGLSLNNMKNQIQKAQIYTITLTIFGIMLGMFGANIMAQKISNPLRNLLQVVTMISQGILQERVFINTGDEVETLANGINLMSKELSKIVTNINNSATELAGTSDILFSTTKNSKDYIEAIKDRINDINKGVVITTNSVDKTVSSMNRLTASAKNIHLNSTNAADYSQLSEEKAVQGMKSVQNFNYKIYDIKNAFEQILQMVGNLNQSISKIETFTSSITRITKKTNTLAYNVNLASLKSEGKKEVIEEISSQVRLLSNDIESAALNIFNTIEDTKLNMKKVIIAVNSGNERVEEGNVSAEDANKSLGEIVKNVNNVKEMIYKINELSQQQSTNVEAGTKDIKSISNVTNNTAFELKGILKNIEEQVSLIQVTFAKANELYILAERLKKYVKFFSKRK